MIHENESPIQTKKMKYKPSKTGKIALGISFGSVLIVMLSIILSFFKSGIIVLIVCISANIIAMMATLVLLVDVIKYNNLNNVNEKRNSEMIIYLVVGIVIGFIWGKML